MKNTEIAVEINIEDFFSDLGRTLSLYIWGSLNETSFAETVFDMISRSDMDGIHEERVLISDIGEIYTRRSVHSPDSLMSLFNFHLLSIITENYGGSYCSKCEVVEEMVEWNLWDRRSSTLFVCRACFSEEGDGGQSILYVCTKRPGVWEMPAIF